MSKGEMAYAVPGDPAAGESRQPFLTVLESSALALGVITLLLLYHVEAAAVRSTRPSARDIWLFVPHVALIALIVARLRRLAAVAQALILIPAALVGMATCIDAVGGHRTSQGLGYAAVLQLPLFILCLKSAKDPLSALEPGRLGPRLALGALAGAIGLFAATAAVWQAGAPVRAADARALAARHREAAKREAEARAATLAACLQRVPATPDSQPVFPGALSELPNAECPESRLPAPDGFVIEYSPGPVDSAGGRRKFSLSVHDQTASDTAVSYEIDESMILRGWRGRGARRDWLIMSSRALDLLTVVGECIERARSAGDAGGFTRYPGSLAEAEQRQRCGLRITSDSQVARMADDAGRYDVRYTPPPRPRPRDVPGGYTLLLEPVRDSRGRSMGATFLSFLSDTAGLVHMTRRGRAATEADSALPDCSTPRYARPGGMTFCRVYRARQRWGLGAVPAITSSLSSDERVRAGDTLNFSPWYRALTPPDLAIEAHIQWQTDGGDSAITRRRGTQLGEVDGNGVRFRMRHVYADTGMKHIHFRVRTAVGEEYERFDSVRVVPPRAVSQGSGARR